MRIRRIALRNFRGVTLREVAVPPEGVTVIEGPNEVGKSSLVQAIDLLFDKPDSSRDEAVRAVQPVGADVGAEVEVELTVGAYHLIYWKRWHRQPGTTLRVLAPAPEQLTGRPAHDRVNEILAKSIDPALWKALRYQQGVAISQVPLGDSPSLLTALDAAAAGKGLGAEGEAEDLWSRVGEERSRYFTLTGQPRNDRVRLAENVEAARAEVGRLTRELAELESAAEEHRRLRLELTELAGRLGGQERVVEEREAEWSRLQAKRQEVERLATEAERAANLVEKADAAHRKRLELVGELQAAVEKLAELAELAEREAPGLATAMAGVSDARDHRDKARQAYLSAEEAAERAAADFEYFREQFNLQMLEERQQRVQQAERQQGEALAFLDACPIDTAKLEEIEQAFLSAATARAGLSAESASIRVEALGETRLEVDGRERWLSAGEVEETEVTGSIEVVVPGLVRMTVTGGARTREAEQQVAAAEQRLQSLYAVAGVSGDDALAQARELERRRRSAAQTAEQAAESLRVNLRDLTPQGLAEMIDRTRSRTEAYSAGRPGDPPLPADREEAQAASERAAARLQAAKEGLDQRTGELETAEEILRQVRDAGREREFRRQAVEETIQALSKELAAERETAADEQVAAALTDAEQTAEAASMVHRAAAAELQALNPEEVSALAENAREVLEGMRQSRRQAEIQLAGVRSLLDIKGEEGLHDLLDRAETQLVGLEREQEHTDRRAEASELLYRTLGKHRDAAKRAYVAPFREQLEGFARIVFGGDLSLEVDHEKLRVVSRTLGGVTVPYGSLSKGAQEQLSLLARLACAVLVGRPGGGGVPVIIDDALGNSDPARLERLGAVLSLAGRHVQVIVLTCTPDRYRNVGSAKVIRLPSVEGETRPGGDEIAESAERAAEPGEQAGSGEAMILACLRAAGIPLGRSEIISRSGLPAGRWQTTIGSLLADGQVVREGERGGTRYRLPSA